MDRHPSRGFPVWPQAQNAATVPIDEVSVMSSATKSWNTFVQKTIDHQDPRRFQPANKLKRDERCPGAPMTWTSSVQIRLLLCVTANGGCRLSRMQKMALFGSSGHFDVYTTNS